ncbi:MAG: hypothetical protein HGA78_03005 [Nitrospirales bacterium]|nr:hypothetical protein [Nitrospirales bacterium]
MQNRLRLLPFILVFLFLSCLSCGKKGDPTLKSFEKPQAVKDLRAVHREGEIILTWSYPEAERAKLKGFLLEKSEGGVFLRTASLKNDAFEYRDREFKERAAYSFRIRALSLRDVMSDDSNILQVLPSPLPSPPSGLSYRLTKDSLEISWKGEGFGVLYDLFKTREKGIYPLSTVNKAPLSEPSFIDRIDTSAPVYYSVRAFVQTGIRDEGYPSEDLVVDPASFIPSRPTGLRFIPSDHGVYLTWDESDETWVKGYRIYRKRGGEPGFSAIGESTVPAFHDREPMAERSFYAVAAMGPVKESLQSDYVEIVKREEQ